MGGKKLSSPKARSGKTSARSSPAKNKSGQSPKAKLSQTPKTKAVSEQQTHLTSTKASLPRTRRRASDFATKKRSTKKRPREAVEEAADTDGIENTVRELRDAFDAGADEGQGSLSKELLNALKRARDAFENDGSGSSSSEEEDMESPQSSPKTPRSATNAPESGEEADFVTPTATKRKKGAAQTSIGKKKRGEQKGKQVTALKMPTASAHKRDIEALKRDDPEFYKFLEENDAALLDFDDEDDLGGLDDGAGEQSDSDEEDHLDGNKAVEKEDVGSDFEMEETDHDRDADDDDNENENSTKREEQGDVVGDDDDLDSKEGTRESEESDEEDGPEVDVEAAAGDGHGYSDDDSEGDESEEVAEAEAAAEAGLDLNGVNSNREISESEGDREDGERNELDDSTGGVKEASAARSKKIIFVDMEYLRDIKTNLKSTRSSLKSAKELLRLFRAGKDILPGQQSTKKGKGKGKKQSQEHERGNGLGEHVDMEDEEFADDGSFTSGKVRFASAKAYQHAMNLAIVGIQDALDGMFGKPGSKKPSSARQVSKWDPTESSRWFNLQPVFKSFVFHMLSLCDAVVDPATSRFLMKRLERLVPYTRDNKILLKKIIRIAIRVWSADALHMSEASRLRAYLLLSKLAHGPGNAETVLRSCCAAYSSSIANVCNPRKLPQINFATKCLVELFGIDMGASYTTAFASLREMAISLRAVLVSKQEKDEVERIHNWSYVNRLRLWSQILGRYGSEDELHPLIYPYVQVSLGVMRVHATPRTFPLRLHLASYLSELMAQTGTYIPLAPHLLLLLRCSELRKKPTHGNSKALEWRTILRVSNDVIRTKPFLTGVVDGVVLQLAKYFTVFSRHVSFPEIAHVAGVTLRKLTKEMVVREWKEKIMAVIEKIRQTSEMITEARSKADFSPQGAASSEGMLGCVPGIDSQKKTPIQRFYEVELARILKQETLRDEKANAKPSQNRSEREGKGTVSDEEGSDSEEEPAAKRAKRGESVKRKQLSSRGKPSLSIVDAELNDAPDIVQELSMDSDDSSDEE